MRQLYRFLCLHKNLLTFLLLEVVGLFLVFNHRVHKELQIFQHTPKCLSVMHESVTDLRMYAKWKTTANDLLTEMGELRTLILQQGDPCNITPPAFDIHRTWDVIPATVINNATQHSKNYITINQGADSGITPGMGVMDRRGIVGRVLAVSKNYASVISLLHTDMQVSAKLASCGVMGTICWKGHNPRKVILLYIPKYLNVPIGEKVVTSGYSTSFYAGIPIGEVTQVTLAHAADLYEIEVELTTDFSALQHVYVLKNNHSTEQADLESQFKPRN